MAKKNPYRKGSNKWIYFDEVRKLRNRIKQWERKYHISFEDIPNMPQTVRKQDIERIKQIKYKNLSEAEIKRAKFNYQWKYEQSELPSQYKPKQEYTPPSEQDFYDDSYDDYFEEPEPIGNEPANSSREMDAWLDMLFNEILDYNDEGRNSEARDILQGLLNDARNRLGSQALYEYLEDGDNVSRLHNHAVNALSGSPDKAGNLTGHQWHEIEQFAQILNLGRPLSQGQAEVLQQEGFVDFDFSDYD